MTLKRVIDADKSAQVNFFCVNLRPAFFGICVNRTYRLRLFYLISGSLWEKSDIVDQIRGACCPALKKATLRLSFPVRCLSCPFIGD